MKKYNIKLHGHLNHYKGIVVYQKFSRIFSSNFIRNVFTVVSGAAVAQVISLLFTPIITRLYGPEAYGVLGVFMSVVAILNPIAALTFPIAIVLPKEEKEAKGLILLSLYTATIISSFLLLVFLLFGNFFIDVFNVKEIKPFILLIPLFIFIGAHLQVTQQWLIRKKYFSVIAKVNVLQALLSNLNKFGFGFYFPFAYTLVLITTIGNGVYTLLLLWKARAFRSLKVRGKSLKKEYSINKLYSLARKYNDFPLFRTPEAFINGISQSLPIFMLTIFFGPIAAGFYTISKSVLDIPSQLIGKSVGDVFYPRISEAAQNNENISRLLVKATASLFLVGIIPFGLIIILGPWLFSLVFGAEWLDAGKYARWLALLSLFVFINIPSVKTIPVISAQKFFLLFTLFSTIVRLIALLIGGLIYGNGIISIALYSVTGALLNITLIIITFVLSLKYRRRNLPK